MRDRRRTGRKCPLLCKCSCHRFTWSQSPSWLWLAAGNVSLRYNYLPYYSKGPCDSPLCRSRSVISITIRYHPPQWLAARTILVSLTWGTLTDMGASLWIRVPRIVDLPLLFEALESNNGEEYISAMGILPADVDSEDYDTLLTVGVCVVQIRRFPG